MREAAFPLCQENDRQVWHRRTQAGWTLLAEGGAARAPLKWTLEAPPCGDRLNGLLAGQADQPVHNALDCP